MARDDLPCQNEDPDLWFPVSSEPTPQSDLAVARCGRCPIQQACLTDALERGIDHGIWGGKLPNERRWILRTGGFVRTRSKDADHRNRTELVRQMADLA